MFMFCMDNNQVYSSCILQHSGLGRHSTHSAIGHVYSGPDPHPEPMPHPTRACVTHFHITFDVPQVPPMS